jgi:hypothetical protein
VPTLKDDDRPTYKDDPETFAFARRLLVDSDGTVGSGLRIELTGAFVLGSLEEGADVILERYSKDPIFRALRERRGSYLLDMMSRRFDIDKDDKDNLRDYFSIFFADEERRLRVMIDILRDYLWWDLTEQSRERISALESEFFGPGDGSGRKDQNENKSSRNDEETADDELSGKLNGMTPFVKDGGTGIPVWDDSFRRLDSEREGQVLRHRAIRFCIPAEMIKNSVDFFAVMKKMAILNGTRLLGLRSFSIVITGVKESDVPILQGLMTDRFRKLIGMRRNFKITLMTSGEIGEAAEALGVDIADPKARVELIRQMVTGRDAPKKGEKIAIFVDGVPKGESSDAKRAISAGMDLGSSPESLLVFLFPSSAEGTVCYSFAEIMNRCMKAFNEFGNDGRLLVDIIPPTGIFTEQMRRMVEETRAMLKMLASA